MIQWFPGHMAKARREIEEKLKLVDVVIELVDARAPLSTQNPMLQEVIHQKEKIIVLMKRDLADAIQTNKWLQHIEAQGTTAIALDVNNKKEIQLYIEIETEKGIEKQCKSTGKGVQQGEGRAARVFGGNVEKPT